MPEKYDALIEQVADRLCIYWGPGDPLSISEERLVAIIDLVRADERTRIRTALLSDEAVFAFGEVVTSRDDNADDATFRQWKEGIELGFIAAIAAIGLTEGDTDHA